MTLEDTPLATVVPDKLHTSCSFPRTDGTRTSTSIKIHPQHYFLANPPESLHIPSTMSPRKTTSPPGTTASPPSYTNNYSEPEPNHPAHERMSPAQKKWLTASTLILLYIGMAIGLVSVNSPEAYPVVLTAGLPFGIPVRLIHPSASNTNLGSSSSRSASSCSASASRRNRCSKTRPKLALSSVSLMF
jgi:hypothetical protein